MRLAVLLVGALALGPIVARAQGQPADSPSPTHPVSLIANGGFAQPLDGNWGRGDGTALKVEPFEAQVAGKAARAVRLVANPPADANAWDVQFGQPCLAPVRKGDAVYFRVWLRSPDRAKIGFIYEMAKAPNTKYIDRATLLTADWKEYRFAGRAAQDFGPRESQAKFFLGYGKGTVEVADVRVEDYGAAPGYKFDETIDYWGGRPNPDAWRKTALERIEKIRKGDLTVQVVDAAGKPVPNATVTVKQQTHLFRFGTAAPAGLLADDQSPDAVRFRQEVARLYNVVTFENDLKWDAQSWTSPATVDKAAEWLKAHNIAVRGHNLVWGSFHYLPAGVRDLRGQALADAIKKHIQDYGARMKGRVYLWDVVNEAGSETEVWDNVGWENFANAYKWAREADPGAQLCYNDYNIINENDPYRKKVAARVRYLLDHGAPVDVLGIQGHMSAPLTPINRVLELLDEWAAFGKPLEITEYDAGIPDDKQHAEYVRDCMIAAFSHPAVQSLIMWGFWEGAHWRAKDGGAMFRRDWSKRPAQEAWEDLVLKQWSTDWTGKTGKDGTVKLRAFYGKVEIHAKLADGAAPAVIDLRPGGATGVTVRLGGSQTYLFNTISPSVPVKF